MLLRFTKYKKNYQLERKWREDTTISHSATFSAEWANIQLSTKTTEIRTNK